MWVSDTATHFKNRVMAQLSNALKVDHRSAVADTPWSNGTCERMVREVVHFDFLYVGSSGPEGSKGLPEEDGFRYILVIMDDLSNFVSLEPAEACTVGLHSRGYG